MMSTIIIRKDILLNEKLHVKKPELVNQKNKN